MFLTVAAWSHHEIVLTGSPIADFLLAPAERQTVKQPISQLSTQMLILLLPVCALVGVGPGGSLWVFLFTILHCKMPEMLIEPEEDNAHCRLQGMRSSGGEGGSEKHFHW